MDPSTKKIRKDAYIYIYYTYIIIIYIYTCISHICIYKLDQLSLECHIFSNVVLRCDNAAGSWCVSCGSIQLPIGKAFLALVHPSIDWFKGKIQEDPIFHEKIDGFL